MSLSTKHFMFDPKTKTFIAELSDLPGLHLHTRTGYFMGKCVEALDLESHKTGNEVSFFLNKVERNRDGDIECYKFEMLHDGDAEKYGRMKVVILND